MKNDLLKGAAIGFCVCLLTLGIGATALAAVRTISIDDGIKVTVDGKTLTPKDGKGNTVPVFTYEGTTYVPARALADAMGFQITYNSDTRVVAVTKPVDAVSSATTSPGATPAVTEDSSYVGQAKAREAALKHAGLKADAVTFTKTQLDRENGKAVYEIEFTAATKEYDYEIDALTGAVIKGKIDR